MCAFICHIYTYIYIYLTFDFCRILVLNQGHVEEFDTPTNLLRQENTIFYSMMMNAGLTWFCMNLHVSLQFACCTTYWRRLYVSIVFPEFILMLRIPHMTEGHAPINHMCAEVKKKKKIEIIEFIVPFVKIYPILEIIVIMWKQFITVPWWNWLHNERCCYPGYCLESNNMIIKNVIKIC